MKRIIIVPNYISVAFNLIFNTKDLLSTVMQTILLATHRNFIPSRSLLTGQKITVHLNKRKVNASALILSHVVWSACVANTAACFVTVTLKRKTDSIVIPLCRLELQGFFLFLLWFRNTWTTWTSISFSNPCVIS